MTNIIRSGTPCPFCGSTEWYGYFFQADGSLDEEHVSSPEMYPPLIDCDYDLYFSIHGALDECVNCGAVIGV